MEHAPSAAVSPLSSRVGPPAAVRRGLRVSVLALVAASTIAATTEEPLASRPATGAQPALAGEAEAAASAIEWLGKGHITGSTRPERAGHPELAIGTPFSLAIRFSPVPDANASERVGDYPNTIRSASITIEGGEAIVLDVSGQNSIRVSNDQKAGPWLLDSWIAILPGMRIVLGEQGKAPSLLGSTELAPTPPVLAAVNQNFVMVEKRRSYQLRGKLDSLERVVSVPGKPAAAGAPATSE